MKIKTLFGIIGLFGMTVSVFLGQTFCDFLNGDYGDWMNAVIWTSLTAAVLVALLIMAVVGMSKQGAHVQTWHIVGIVCFILFIGASFYMAAPSFVHTFTVMSRKGDIADKAREIRDNTDMMYQEYSKQSEARAGTLKSNIDVALIDAPKVLAGMYPKDDVYNSEFSVIQSESFKNTLMLKYDRTWEDKLRSKYGSALIYNFSVFTAGALLKSMIAFHKSKHTDFSEHFAKVQNPFEQQNFSAPEFDFAYVDYAAQVSDLFGKRRTHAGGIALFIFALLLSSFPFIFIKNNKVKNTRKAKDGDGIYNQGYPLK